MKNIHLLPTEKPSRLRYNLSNQIVLIKESYRANYGEEANQQLYITSDEEIKKDIKMFINIYLSSNMNNLKPGLSEKIFIEFI